MNNEDRERKLDAVEKALGMVYRGTKPKPIPKDWEKMLIDELRPPSVDGITAPTESAEGEVNEPPELVSKNLWLAGDESLLFSVLKILAYLYLLRFLYVQWFHLVNELDIVLNQGLLHFPDFSILGKLFRF